MNNQVLEYVKEYLRDEIEYVEENIKTCSTVEKLEGTARKELAEELLYRIGNYEKANSDHFKTKFNIRVGKIL
jgi:hypothetical protein